MRPRYHRLLAAFAEHIPAAMARVCASAALAGLLAPAGSATARTSTATAEAAGAKTLVIEGAGDGHGVGMSQEGALGYAQHGWSYEQILAHYYTGTSLGKAPAHAVVRVLLHGKVKRIPLERYVRGVVGAEVSADWPMAALEAQAVASRTYALTAHAGGSKFDVYADTRSQMYLGKAAETQRTTAAVQATAGQIVTYDGQPAITYFFASSGGRTESVQNAFPGASPQPWLVSVEDPYDSGPLHRWKLTLTMRQAGARLKGLAQGKFEGVEVLERGASPRIVSAYVLGSKGKTLVSGAQLEERLGLYDTWAYFSIADAHGTHAEPDLSGMHAESAPLPEGAVPANATATEITPQGGTAGPTSPGLNNDASQGGTVGPTSPGLGTTQGSTISPTGAPAQDGGVAAASGAASSAGASVGA